MAGGDVANLKDARKVLETNNSVLRMVEVEDATLNYAQNLLLAEVALAQHMEEAEDVKTSLALRVLSRALTFA